ncbi:MAG TPA: sterol desaturase family protein [Acidimicrobiales bacterium]|nr:sterol desaturase family protein [Acidimicrobiales bacterium]
MPAAAIAWLTTHAVVLLAGSVAVTVLGELAVDTVRRRRGGAGTATSVTAGLAYLAAKGLVSKTLLLGAVLAVYQHRVFDLDWTNPLVWLAIFVGRDFAYYWIHRAEHRVNVLWASHMVHHSIERFTFTSAVRLPWMESVYKPVLALWVPLVGFPPAAFAAMGALVLLAGQLQHTELVRGRTVLDRLFVTPSAHRVHHGSNPEYLDKNFGSMLIVWDRWFGTYEPETVPVRYGLAGGKRVATPAQALVGGYPALVSAARSRAGLAERARYLVAAP